MPLEIKPDQQFFPQDLKFQDRTSKKRIPSKAKEPLGSDTPFGKFAIVNPSDAKMGQTKPGKDLLGDTTRSFSNPGHVVELDFDAHTGSQNVK